VGLLILNKKNVSYIKGKRKHPAVNLEGYDNLAKQIKEQAKLPPYSCDEIVTPMTRGGFLVPGFVYLVFGTISLLGFAGMLKTQLSYLITGSPQLDHIAQMIGTLVCLSLSLLFFRLYIFLCLEFRTQVHFPSMRKFIKNGIVIMGQVEAVQAGHSGKRKIRGERKINIEYTFTTPDGMRLKGAFTTSKAKAAASGDEVAVWYIDNELLHILL
jgi:hypothetical protein